MKKTVSKLSLYRETVLPLDRSRELEKVVGGRPPDSKRECTDTCDQY